MPTFNYKVVLKALIICFVMQANIGFAQTEATMVPTTATEDSTNNNPTTAIETTNNPDTTTPGDTPANAPPSPDQPSTATNVSKEPTPKAVALIEQLPNFKTLNTKQLVDKIEAGFNKCNTAIETALNKPLSWDNTIQPVVEQLAVIKGHWNLLVILNHVDQSGDTRSALNNLVPKMASFHGQLMHNLDFYKALQKIQNGSDFDKLNQNQQVFLKQTLLDYKLYGADLDATQQQRYIKIITRLRELGDKYTDNLNNATDAFQYFIPAEDSAVIAGLPESILKQAASRAKEQDKSGWILTLSTPDLVAVETYAKDRNLRQTFYNAFATLASSQDPDINKRKWDNSGIVAETLELRHELAELLGYRNFAAYAIADRTPPDPAAFMQFLVDLANELRPAAIEEFKKLENFAKLDKQKMQPWDLAFYAQWDKGVITADSQIKSREYLQLDNVIQGLLNLTSILFNIDFAPVQDANTWDPKVRAVAVSDVNNKVIGYLYFDLFTRTNKAPNDKTLVYVTRLNAPVEVLPVVVISTNLADDGTGLITHDACVRIFAQFGESLLHLLAKQDYPIIANSNGMLWDAVSQASQFMQNWAWQKDYLQDIAKHYKTGESLPDSLYETLVQAQRFDAAINLLQQVQLAMFDLRIHLNLPEDKGKTALQIQKEINKQYGVLPTLATDMLPNRFSETFTTNIAATYFCYYWDKTIAADSYATFLDNGVLTAKIGHKYRETLLEQGGQQSIMQLFEQFQGRPPKIKPLLQILNLTK